ncbi:hypothetical protein E2P81_ATG10567, partial [Venturia nashicola]
NYTYRWHQQRDHDQRARAHDAQKGNSDATSYGLLARDALLMAFTAAMLTLAGAPLSNLSLSMSPRGTEIVWAYGVN